MASIFYDNKKSLGEQIKSSFDEKFRNSLEMQRWKCRRIHLEKFISEYLPAAYQLSEISSGNSVEKIDVGTEPADALRMSLQKGNPLHFQQYSEQLFRTVGDKPHLEKLNEILMASWRCDTDKVKKLVEKEFSLDVQDSTGRDPLAIAMVTGNRELQQFIENHSDQSFQM